jgi:CRISPR system Cascade subunit CasB
MRQPDLFDGGSPTPGAELGAARPAASRPPDEAPEDYRTTVERIADQFVRNHAGLAPLPTAVSSRLRRLRPTEPGRALTALMPVLVAAGLAVGRLGDQDLRRWALVTQVVAILAGTGGAAVRSREVRTGRALHAAGYAEARLMRLLTARGPALGDQMMRLARFLAAKGGVPLDLRPLAELALHEGLDEARAEAARMAIARGYYAAAAKADAPGAATH